MRYQQMRERVSFTWKSCTVYRIVIVSVGAFVYTACYRAAVDAGKHVLVEFPVVVDYGQLDPLYAMATDKGQCSR